MRRLHGPRWRDDAGAPRGRLRRHVLVTAVGATALAATAARARRTAAAAGGAWLGATLAFTAERALPGPRTRREVAAMAVTSAAIPPAAALAYARGWWSSRRLVPSRRMVPADIDAVLFDRDGTLVVDVPYNGDPARVQPVPGARAALDSLRGCGVAVGVVTNQSGVGRGTITAEQMAAVNARVEEVLGPFGVWAVCSHAPQDGCRCRKPAPGLIERAAAALGVAPERCAVIGDIGADVEAATRAGAIGVIVPTPVTRADEIGRADFVAPDLSTAVDLVLSLRGGA
jgi:HAD superfamily hydrolase (TIGR01662 family)